jgi:acetolactate synthase I/II/III large subunit
MINYEGEIHSTDEPEGSRREKPKNMTAHSISTHVAQALAAHVSDVFGVMGNGNAYLLDALAGTTSNYTAVRHEAGAVAAADAYYRASGRLAAATATYGAGFTNTLTALTEAIQARVPLVLLVGDAPSTGPRPWDVDQVAIAATLGAATVVVTKENAAAATVHAIEQALHERRPVVLALPYDLAAAECGPPPSATKLAPIPLRSPSENDLEEAFGAIRQAKHPILLAGRGAWLAGAGAELGRLASAAGALTATTALARSIFPEERYDLGVTGGFGQEEAMHLVHEADVVAVFGASLSQFTTRFGDLFGEKTHVIQVDVAGATSSRVDTAVVCDARLAASALADRLEREPREVPDWRSRVDLASTRWLPPGNGTAPDGRLDPRSVAVRLAQLLPVDRVVVSDGGHFIGWANMYWPVAAPNRMMMVGTAFQTIGLGLPSAVGAAVACPDSAIVLTTGDGGALMALADLESAVRACAGRGIAVVWNDAAYGAELNLYGLKGLAQAPMRIPEVDFATLAEGVGAEGVVIREIADLDVLQSWSARPVSGRPFLLLDVRISPDIIAPYQHEIIAINR